MFYVWGIPREIERSKPWLSSENLQVLDHSALRQISIRNFFFCQIYVTKGLPDQISFRISRW